MSVVRQVARAVGTDPLPPGSAAERAVADRLVEWLRARGDHGELRARRAAMTVWGWGAALGALGSLVSVASGWAGTAIAAAGLVVLALWAVPGRRQTQDVVVAAAGAGGGTSEPSEVARGRGAGPARRGLLARVRGGDGTTALIITAGYGSPRRGWRLRWLRGRRGLLTACGALVTGAAIARGLGVGGAILGAAQLVPTLCLLAAAASALDRVLAGWGPPGEAAAIAVAVHDELAARPPRVLSPGLLLQGGGAPRARHAVVLEIAPQGTGARAVHPQLEAAVLRALGALEVETEAIDRPGRMTVRVGGADAERAIDLALAVVDALDASL